MQYGCGTVIDNFANPMRRFFVFLVAFIMTILTSPTASAKIVDCPSLNECTIIYSSHGSFLEARDYAIHKLLWHTELFDPRNFPIKDRMLETDVQANIACLRFINDSEVVATDSAGNLYRVDKHQGTFKSRQSLLRGQRAEIFLSTSAATELSQAHDAPAGKHCRDIIDLCKQGLRKQ